MIRNIRRGIRGELFFSFTDDIGISSPREPTQKHVTFGQIVLCSGKWCMNKLVEWIEWWITINQQILNPSFNRARTIKQRTDIVCSWIAGVDNQATAAVSIDLVRFVEVCCITKLHA